MTEAHKLTELVTRLRNLCLDWDGSQQPDGAEPISVTCANIREAADALSRLRAELAEVRAALKPRDFDWLGDTVELLTSVNEWFGQRKDGVATTNSEDVMWREVHRRLELLAPSEPLH